MSNLDLMLPDVTCLPPPLEGGSEAGLMDSSFPPPDTCTDHESVSQVTNPFNFMTGLMVIVAAACP